LYLRENLFGVDFCHFGNRDEVPVRFDMPSSRTVNLMEAKEVSVATTGHKRSNFTVVLCITADGSKLPFSEMEAEEIPKEILNAIDSFNVESNEEFLGFE
jgi:hypothetical protein